MFQLIITIAFVITSGLIAVKSYRLMLINEGKNQTAYDIWWWMTAFAIITVVCTSIMTGTIIQRIYF